MHASGYLENLVYIYMCVSIYRALSHRPLAHIKSGSYGTGSADTAPF